MTTPLQEAIWQVKQLVFQEVKSHGCVSEALEELNCRNRNIVELMQKQFGECWLGKVNLGSDYQGESSMKQWDGSFVLNFSCDFCLPKYDAILDTHIIFRKLSIYKDCKSDLIHLVRITKRIDKLGGHSFIWS